MDKDTLDILIDSLSDVEWSKLKLRADARKAHQSAQIFEAKRSSAIKFGDWILKHNVMNGYDGEGSSCWVVPDGSGECFTTLDLYNIHITGQWDDLEEDEDE